MAYFPLQLAPETPELVALLMRKGVEPLFNDVHVMLRLPIAELGPGVGCNFTIAHVLLAVTAGVSATFYTRGLGDGKAFRGVLSKFYPWELEPEGESVETRADVLWSEFRNPFAHSLGLAMERTGHKQREFQPRRYQLKIGRDKASMREEAIEAIERSSARPALNPTLVLQPHKKVLWVEPFYWGVREMLLRMSRETELMGQVDAALKADLAKSGVTVE
jgi:hypothetical protein